MRAEEPQVSSSIERDGVTIGYEIYGTSGPTIVLLPCWIIVHARSWKAQIADLAKDCRVIVIDGRGNGASDRPRGSKHYSIRAYAEDAVAIIDHLQVTNCVLVGFSSSGPQVALIAQDRPSLVRAAIIIGPTPPRRPEELNEQERAFLARRSSYDKWKKFNACFIREHYEEFIRFFFGRMFCEPHSTKQIEDAIAWASETDAEALIDTVLGRLRTTDDIAAAYSAIQCPVLLIHGTADEIVPVEAGREVAALCSAEMIEMEGSGHGPHLRHPVFVNAAIREFLTRHSILKPQLAERGKRRSRPRALYLSSPIGLGHARRDLAVAHQLKLLRPDLQIDWLAQSPLTHFLDASGERCHDASRLLASESRHIEDEAGEHDLNVFQALRSMDEILVRNFRVFQSVLEEERYDLVIADEAWEVDHFWHEHPAMKQTALAWMTDFVGFAPLPQGGDYEARLTADYNREMVNHVERHASVRDRAIFVGNAADAADPITFTRRLEGPTLRRIADIPGYVRREHRVEPHPTETRLRDARLFVLTSNETRSAGEHFAMALKTTGRGTVMGETTAGAGRTTMMRLLGGGFAAAVPVGHTVDPNTGKGWEGTGISPHVAVPAERALVEALVRSGVPKAQAERISAQLRGLQSASAS